MNPFGTIRGYLAPKYDEVSQDIGIAIHSDAEAMVVRRKEGNQDTVLIVGLHGVIRVVTLETAGRSKGTQTRNAVHRTICSIADSLQDFTAFNTISSMEKMGELVGPPTVHDMVEKALGPANDDAGRTPSRPQGGHRRAHIARQAKSGAKKRRAVARRVRSFGEEAIVRVRCGQWQKGIAALRQAKALAADGNRDAQRAFREAFERVQRLSLNPLRQRRAVS